jgi:hypothetical protein
MLNPPCNVIVTDVDCRLRLVQNKDGKLTVALTNVTHIISA